MLEHATNYFDASFLESLRAMPRNLNVRIFAAIYHPLNVFMFKDGLSAGRRAALMVARLKGDNKGFHGAELAEFLRQLEHLRFSVRHSGFLVSGTQENFAISIQSDRAHGGIRGGLAEELLSRVDRHSHG